MVGDINIHAPDPINSLPSDYVTPFLLLNQISPWILPQGPLLVTHTFIYFVTMTGCHFRLDTIPFHRPPTTPYHVVPNGRNTRGWIPLRS
ncbi:hypothetical protein J6590_060154 [Homalodisca vitripennis]|nr:hypothetical protein J6590_060154 [Homalodisca vitripennis]